jgi:PAS domain S-box-containing protein
MMNTLHKFLTIAFLAASIFISGLNVDFVGAQNAAVDPAASRRPADLQLSPYLRFGRVTAEDGLSNVQIKSIVQDNHGFMWFGTLDGLNRYDGAGIKVYRHDPDDPHSLSHNYVRALAADQSGVLWLGTWGGGLNQYDREKDAFIRYQHDPDDPHSLSNNIIRVVYEDRAGTIWLGTMGGLNKLDRESRRFTRYRHAPDDPHSLSNNTVWTVFEDSTGVLWVGTEGGLNRFDPKTEQFTHFRHDPDDPASLSHNTVKSISGDSSGNLWVGTDNGLCNFNPERTWLTRYQHDLDDPQTLSNNLVAAVYVDRAGELWVGTWGGGLNRFDRETETFTHYRHDPADPYSLIDGIINQIYEGRHGMLWIATDGGISILDGRAKPFHHYRAIPGDPNSLSDNAVFALHAGRAGVVWVGTGGGGLNKLDRQTEKFTHYRHDPADPNSLSNDTVRTIYEDRMGLIWVGTVGGGLDKFDPATERFTHHRHDAADPRSLSNDDIPCIYQDRTGTLWIGTWGGGLNALDRESGQFTRYRHDPDDPHTLSNNAVSSVFEDREGVLWIGTMEGLNKFDRETQTFTRYQHISTDPQSLAHNSVTSIYEDRTGTLWIGTAGGLDKFDRHNDQFTHYTTANGLPSDTIYGILQDEQGRLWLSTPKGLSRFDPRTESFRNYTVSDGLQSNTFLFFSAHSKSRSGEMFFGGSNGFNAFYPDQIVDNLAPPPVWITDFQLANKPVPIGGDSVLQKSILATDKLVLSYRDQVFSFEFVVLNYQAPELNRYRYRMDGFEKEWNEVGSTRRYVTYTHLAPGDYVFRVIGSNNDGIWNEEGASIKITITPPWWATIWFRIGMVVVAIGLLGGGFRWRVSAIEARSRELEIQLQRMAQIRQMQAERDRILEVSQDMISISGMDGYFKYLNPAWKKNLGYTDEELMSKPLLDFVHPDDRAKTLGEIESLAAGRRTVDFENRYTHKDGSIRHLSWMATPLPDEKRIYAVARDITERKQAEQMLQSYQQRLKALASQQTITEEKERRRIAADLHDHVSQSLALARIQIASARKLASDPRQTATLDEISDSLRHAVQETRDLIYDLSPPQLNEIGLSAAISEWLEEQVEKKYALKAECMVSGSEGPMDDDLRAILFRSVRELVTNVIKHARASRVNIRVNQDPDRVKVSVRDDGAGFDVNAKSQSLKADAGFGLFSIKERMADLGGSLEIISEPGQGTEAILAVPLEKGEGDE